MKRSVASFREIWLGTATSKARRWCSQWEPTAPHLLCFTSFPQSSPKHVRCFYNKISCLGLYTVSGREGTVGVRQRNNSRETGWGGRGHHQSTYKSEAKWQLFFFLKKEFSSSFVFCQSRCSLKSKQLVLIKKKCYFSNIYLQASPMWKIPAT